MSAQVTLVGTLGRDPDLRFTPSGTPVANFSMAVNRRWKKGDQWEESTSWFNVTCWRDLAQNVADSLTKGARVIVTGRLEQRSWTTDDGSKRSTVEVVADEVGPSLRWATCDIAKNERSDGTAGASGGAGWDAGRSPDYSPADEPFHGDPFLIWEQP